MLAPKAELLGEFAKYWDINQDIDEFAVQEDLSGARVGGLLYNAKTEAHGRESVKAQLKKLGHHTGGVTNLDVKVGRVVVKEIFMTPSVFKSLVMASYTPIGREVRNYYLLLERVFRELYKKNRADAEAALAVQAAEAGKAWSYYEDAAEQLDIANERLGIFEGDDVHPQRFVSLPETTSPNAKCMETLYGRLLARKVFGDAAIMLWSSHESFDSRMDAAYWNSTVQWLLGVDPELSVYRNHINLETALYKAAKLSYRAIHATHLTYNELYQVIRKLGRGGVNLVQKVELEYLFGDRLAREVQTSMDAFLSAKSHDAEPMEA